MQPIGWRPFDLVWQKPHPIPKAGFFHPKGKGHNLMPTLNESWGKMFELSGKILVNKKDFHNVRPQNCSAIGCISQIQALVSPQPMHFHASALDHAAKPAYQIAGTRVAHPPRLP